MAKVSLVNREMSHTYTYIYIYVTQITKWGLKIQLNYSKYIIFFSSLTLLLLWSTCVTQKGPSCTNKKKIFAHCNACFPQNVAPWTTLLFGGRDYSLPMEHQQWFCRTRNHQATGWGFLLSPLWMRLFPSLPEGATTHHLSIRRRNGGIINPLDLSVQKRCCQPAALHPRRGRDPELLSEGEVCVNCLIWVISRSQGWRTWREGLPAERCDGEPFAATALVAPEGHGGPHQGSKDIMEVHPWVTLGQGTAFQQPRTQLCKESLPAPALQERLPEPILPKVAADLHAVAASVKHEGLIFRRWEA